MPSQLPSSAAVEIPVGTHGLFDALTNGNLLGTLHVTAQRDAWLWKSALTAFPGTFYLDAGAPTLAWRSVNVFELEAKDLVSNTQPPGALASCWGIYRGAGTTPIGWMSHDSNTSEFRWHVKANEVTSGRVTLDANTRMRFDNTSPGSPTDVAWYLSHTRTDAAQ